MKLYRAIGVAAAAGALVAGCGSSSGPSSNSGSSNGIAGKSANQILTAAVNSIRGANSATISLIGPGSKGLQIKNGVFFANGDASATVLLNGASATLIKIGSTDYFNATQAFWAANGLPASEVPRLANIWVSIPDSVTHIGSALALSAIASGLTKNLGSVTKGSTSMIHGQAVIAVISSKQGTLYVATTGTPYPVEAAKTGSGGGTVTFSNWNQGSEPTAPAGAKTLAQLGLGGSASGGSGTSGSSGSAATSSSSAASGATG